ncbi:MAG: ATP-binding protein [Succinivibrio sp.]|nr:ATP-binding protein [Succinivibrio sp.]
MQLYLREKYLRRIRGFYHSADLIKVITGIRRCGKSCLMQMIMAELREQGISAERICYLNLDRRGFKHLKGPEQLDELIASHLQQGSLNYLFIDEIQNVDNFESVINSWREEGCCSIFITGSNSYLLSGELATKLTGRYLEFEMYTLTFDEYLGMKAFCGQQVADNLLLELQNYLQEGGFPRAVTIESLEDKRTYVANVVEEIFHKDIRRRVKIRNVEAFEAVRRYLFSNFGATYSVNSLQIALKKTGLNISRLTLHRYLQVLVEAKILYECERFDLKSRRALAGERKYYLGDLSFYFSLNTDNRLNYGPLLESPVFFYARSLNYRVSIGRIGNLECDFILRDTALDYAYVQVAYTIAASAETEEREYRALERIKDNYPKYVMTTDYLLQRRNGIRHVNLMEFMRAGERF